MLWRGHDNVFQNSQFPDMLCMVPKLHKEMYGCDHCNYLRRQAKQCSGDQENEWQADNLGDWLPETCGEVEILTRMMDYMAVPKNIRCMSQSMMTVGSKIQCKKAEKIHHPVIFYLEYGDMCKDCLITDYNYSQPEHRFNNIRHSST